MVEIAEVSVENDQIRSRQSDRSRRSWPSYYPDSVIAQTQGAITMGLSATLLEEVLIVDGAFHGGNFNQYPLLRNADAPDIDVVVLSSRQTPSGMGEPPIGPIPAAVANVVFTNTGQQLASPAIEVQLSVLNRLVVIVSP